MFVVVEKDTHDGGSQNTGILSVTEIRLTADGVSFSDMSIRCLAELFEILVTRPGAEEGPLPTDAFFYRVIGHSSDNATFFTNR